MKRTGMLLALGIGAVGAGTARPTPVASVRSIAALTFDASKIRIAQDSFEISVAQLGQGMRAGTEVVEVRKDGTKFTFVETIAAATIGMAGTLTISLGAGLEPLLLVGHYSFQGVTGTDSVSVQNGRLIGSTQTPSGPGTMQTHKVDAAMTNGLLLEEDILIALLPTADLSEGLKGSLSVLDGEKGTVGPLDVTVEGKETIDVPAGRFEVFRVRAKSTDVMVLYVSTAAPRRVVRFSYLNAGIEFRLIK